MRHIFRLYCPQDSISGNSVIISDKEQIHYLCDVLRLKEKEEVFVFDGRGGEYTCRVEEILRKHIKLRIKVKKRFKEKNLRLSLACAIPKKGKFDQIVDKLTQLGVAKIIPMVTQRVSVRWQKHQIDNQLGRWRRISIAACQQSGRKFLPSIEPVKSIAEVINSCATYDLKLIPALAEKSRCLKDVFVSLEKKPANILGLIGPEGDFSPEELNLAKEHGFIPITLGDLVLRTETAAVAMAAFIRLNANH